MRFELEEGELLVETAPLDVMPHATHWFLTLVETGFWDGCHVIRNANHVMQLNCNYRNPRHKRQPSVAFQVHAWADALGGRCFGSVTSVHMHMCTSTAERLHAYA